MGKIYFVSDLHLGVPAATDSATRERDFIRWLDQIAPDAERIFIIGDLFDFYFEYTTVVPKGYVRVLGALAYWRDRGVPIDFFIGNHDMWIFSYFEKELGIPTHRHPIALTLHGKKCLIGHGDGLGPGDKGYKILKAIFASRICQWLFERIHPNLGIGIANYWSRQSRYANPDERTFHRSTEWLVQYAESYIEQIPMDYLIFGHRHLPIDCTLSDGQSRYINTGEWLYARSYAVMEDGQLEIQFFEHEGGQIFG